jgi:hypothetical protein
MKRSHFILQDVYNEISDSRKDHSIFVSNLPTPSSRTMALA